MVKTKWVRYIEKLEFCLKIRIMQVLQNWKWKPLIYFDVSFFFFFLYCFFKLIFKIFIGVQLIYNVVLVSDAQQSESVIHVPISTLF